MTADGPAEGLSVEVHRAEPWIDEVPDLVPLIERAARAAADSGGSPPEGSVSVTLLSEAEIAAMNRRWLEREGATDVIAFEVGDDALMADLYIAPEVARRRSAADGVPLREELARLAVHGTLHALGHEHPEDEGRWESEMYRLQELLVARVIGSE